MVFKKWKTDSCLLHIVNEREAVIVVLYIYDILEIRYKPASMDKIEYINEE